jgi:hypothetical protein
VGSYGLAKVEGVASGPLIKGLLSGRLAGAFEHYGGDVENVYQFRITPKYINGSKNGTGRLALRLTPSESLTADFSLSGNKQTGGGVAPPIVSARIGTPADEAMGTIFPPTDPSLVVAHRPHRVKLNRNNDGDMENVNGAFKVVWTLDGHL